MSGKPAIDRTGQRFGKLTVIERDYTRKGGAFWHCQCDCGNMTVAPSGQLTAGMRISCGCALSESKKKHGQSHSALHRTWSGMKERCHNPHNQRYPHYGARGIRVCQRWLNDFAAFRDDMGPRPPGYTIDRIDNDGDYEPSNCRWASVTEQNNNRSFNRRLTVNGKLVTVAQASRITGIPHATILSRLDAGRSDEEAVFDGSFRG